MTPTLQNEMIGGVDPIYLVLVLVIVMIAVMGALGAVMIFMTNLLKLSKDTQEGIRNELRDARMLEQGRRQAEQYQQSLASWQQQPPSPYGQPQQPQQQTTGGLLTIKVLREDSGGIHDLDAHDAVTLAEHHASGVGDHDEPTHPRLAVAGSR